MAEAGLIWLAGGLAVAGVIALRLSWARPARSVGLNAMGWALLLAGLVAGGIAAGAWGIAIASLFAIGTALAILLKAVFEQPRWKRPAKPLRQPRTAEAAGKSSPAGRLATFAITGLLSLIVSVLLALAARLALLTSGASEADGNVAVLGLVPLVWPILAYALLITESRKAQLTVTGLLAMVSLPPILLAGSNV